MAEFQIEFRDHLASVSSADAQTGSSERDDAAKGTGSQSGASDAEELRASMESALKKIQMTLNRILEEVQARTVEYSIEICRAILQCDDELISRRIETCVATAIEALEADGAVTVFVHPESTGQLQTAAAEFENRIEVHEDGSLAPGNCRIEHGSRGLVADLEFQLNAIRRRLVSTLSDCGGSR